MSATILNYNQKDHSNMNIPEPFFISNGSLYKRDNNKKDINKLVSRFTPFITKEFQNIEWPQVFYEIQWAKQNKIIKEIFPASTIAIKKELLELSNKGFSVNENNVKLLIDFLDMFLAINEVNQYYAVERLGEVDKHFIHPLKKDRIRIIANDDGEKQILEGFSIKGTSETWKNEVFARIKNYPKAVFYVLGSFASVIIKDLGVPSFIIDLSGTTSQGKTTMLKVAASVWGDEKLISEWNATKVSIERKAAFLNSFPLLMDDTRKADEKALNSIIYQFSGGKSKGRGSLKGSQKEYTWNNILLSTGEVSLNDYSKGNGGVSARVIPIVDEPLKKAHTNILGLHKAVRNNYGAIGLEFLNLWLEEKEILNADYDIFRNYYIQKSQGKEVLKRLASYFAAIHFTGKILKERLNVDVGLESISLLFDDMSKENKSADKPLEFFEEILTDLDSSRYDIYYESMPQVIKAIYNNGTLFLMPAYLKRFLGVEEKSIRKEWLKRGMSIGDEKSNRLVDYKSLKHKGKVYRAVPLNMTLIKNLGFNFYEKNI